MRPDSRQRGSGTLLVALMLLFSITALLFDVAQGTGESQRASRLLAQQQAARAAAEAGLAWGRRWLIERPVAWLPAGGGLEIGAPGRAAPALPAPDGDRFGINVAFARHAADPRFVRVVADAQLRGIPEIHGRVSAWLRPASVLTRAGEQAPPLVVDGCLSRPHSGADVRPQGLFSLQPGTALASSGPAGCHAPGAANLRGGAIQGGAFTGGGLWAHLFAVSRAELQQLAADEVARGLPPAARRYWWATAADLAAGQWRRSLGRPTAPVVLVFPAALGCPQLGGGAQVHGVVVIEAPCPGGPPWGHFTLFGTLAVGGNLNRLSPGVRLAHIEQAAGQPPRLALPIIEAPQVPGSWRDF
ncbi:hypothetical protein [Thiohalobacter sp.]|uniref:hypothetical protein n=1 Tax=Thiohalobacter sp. TaxID=2025948 RepID=UPI0026262FF5|nr:hypothetical protein [Thiohalobacter sp.]